MLQKAVYSFPPRVRISVFDTADCFANSFAPLMVLLHRFLLGDSQAVQRSSELQLIATPPAITAESSLPHGGELSFPVFRSII